MSGTTSWANAASGNWGTDTNWTNGVPTAACDAVINLDGTYTVGVDAARAAKSLTIGTTTTTGTQTLNLVWGGANTGLTTTNGITNGARGTLTLDSTNGNIFTDVGASTLSNSGTITTTGATNEATLFGSLTNTGTLQANATTTRYRNAGSGTLLNQSVINIANGALLRAETSTSVTNATGGQINGTGTGRLESQAIYNQGAGTTSGSPVRVSSGALNYTGAGASSVDVTAGITLSGTTVAGQALKIIWGGANTGATAAGGFTNGGALTLDTTNGNVFIDVLASTLSNSGTITTTGATNEATLFGSLTNTGTLQANATTTRYRNDGSGTLSNQGAINVANGALLRAESSTSVTDGTGGQINATGTGRLESQAIYNQGAGTTSGSPVRVTSGALDYTGAGASSVDVMAGITLSGTTSAGQALKIIWGAPNTGATAAGGFTNGGTLTLDSTNGSVFIDVGANTLSNSGTITTTGATNEATLLGSLTNTGTVQANATTTRYRNGGSGTLLNQSVINVANGALLRAESSTSVSQSAGMTTVGGNLSVSGSTGPLALSGGTLNGAGTVTGSVNNTGGQVAPGTSVGTLTVTGNYTQGSGTLGIEVNGTGNGQFDVLNVGGSVTLGGTLALQPSNAYAAAAQVGDAVVFLDYGGTRTNQFATTTVNPALNGGKTYTASYDDPNTRVRAVVGSPPDTDGDGAPDPTDNCPSVANPDQANADGDAEGDACDPDDDNDGVADAGDNCPLNANADQANTDGAGDGGDACDPDDDNDGVLDALDACPTTAGNTASGCIGFTPGGPGIDIRSPGKNLRLTKSGVAKLRFKNRNAFVVSGDAVLKSKGKIPTRRASSSATRKRVNFAKSRFQLPSAGEQVVSFKLSKSHRRLVARLRKVKITVAVVARDPLGQTLNVERGFTLKAPGVP